MKNFTLGAIALMFSTAVFAQTANLGDVRNVNQEAGTMEVFTKGSGGSAAGWTTVSTPEAKAKRKADEQKWNADNAADAAARADATRRSALNDNPPIECRFANWKARGQSKEYSAALSAAATRECLSNIRAAEEGRPQSFLALDRYKAVFEPPPRYYRY